MWLLMLQYLIGLKYSLLGQVKLPTQFPFCQDLVLVGNSRNYSGFGFDLVFDMVGSMSVSLLKVKSVSVGISRTDFGFFFFYFLTNIYFPKDVGI